MPSALPYTLRVLPMRADWLLRSSSCCFCIPVRAGFVLMSVLTFVLAGTLSIIIWFEVFHSYESSTEDRVAFVLTGIVETLLFFASTVGFVGVVARKQLFVMIYTYFIYVHFVLNLVVGIYFLVTVRQSNRQELVDSCSDVFGNTSVESSCSELMSISTYVFIAIVAALLLLELYGALIATRYVYRLRGQKRDDRSRRLGYFHALGTPERLSTRYSRENDDVELLGSQDGSGDVRDLGDVDLDIGPPSYTSVSTHDRDLAGVDAPSPPSPYSLSDTASGRRVRALPLRPAVPATTEPLERLPNPHETTSSSEKRHENDAAVSVSTNTHAALMDHAAYIEPRFSGVPPVPSLPP